MKKEIHELEEAMMESIKLAQEKMNVDIKQRKSRYRVIKAREALFFKTQELLENAELNRQI